jgi:hypothetical protein
MDHVPDSQGGDLETLGSAANVLHIPQGSTETDASGSKTKPLRKSGRVNDARDEPQEIGKNKPI